jgi:hypothetical protein
MNKVRRMTQQIVVILHLFPLRIFAVLLLGLAAKTEVRMQAPVLDGPDLIEQSRGNAAGYLGKSIFPDRGIGKDDAKENGSLSG